MSKNEFEIINSYFNFDNHDSAIIVDNGDDAAVISIPKGQQLVTCVDTLVAGQHFLKNTNAFAIAYKAVAVNLSDLSAMGATPKWIMLALTMPDYNEAWMKDFSAGIKHICELYDISLIGGDISKGPLSISITAQGIVPENKALTRSGAKAEDLIFVTGHVGDAAFALKVLQDKINMPNVDLQRLLLVLNKPKPCIEQGISLRDIASSCIDISDGLLADLNHICQQSNVGAKVALNKIPVSPLLKYHLKEKACEFALTGGDDYQLCFTVPKEKLKQFNALAPYFPLGVTCIGEIIKEKSLKVLDLQGKLRDIQNKGFMHFS